VNDPPGEDLLRYRVRDLRDEAARGQGEVVGASACRLARTTTAGHYPTAAAAFYAMTPLVVLGTEAEGSAGTISAAGGVFYALNLGSAVPPAETTVVAAHSGDRWVFRYDG